MKWRQGVESGKILVWESFANCSFSQKLRLLPGKVGAMRCASVSTAVVQSACRLFVTETRPLDHLSFVLPCTVRCFSLSFGPWSISFLSFSLHPRVASVSFLISTRSSHSNTSTPSSVFRLPFPLYGAMLFPFFRPLVHFVSLFLPPPSCCIRFVPHFHSFVTIVRLFFDSA